MVQIIKVPEWATKGPDDLEYRTYRMLSHSSKVLRLLSDGFLWDALEECDAILDFLYHYDAQRIIDRDTISTQLTDVSWENIELVYTTGTQMASDELLNELVSHAIDVYEEVHARIRESWRKISSEISISQAGNRPYFISDGFVIIITPNNRVHVYTFNNPKGSSGIDWRKFKLEFISEFEYSPTDLITYISEIKEKDSDKIVYKVVSSNATRLEGGPINVISSNIFMQLRKDYGF